MAFYLNGDSKKAAREWERLAQKNDADALFNLGQVYRIGAGATPDSRKAEEYYRRAAALGHAPAMRELGQLYLFSGLTPESRAEGLALLAAAAAAGDARAAYLLGVLYFGGDVVSPEPVRAYAWTLLAVEAGLPEAAQTEAALRRALSDADRARAFALSPTLVTGKPASAPFGLLVGEQPTLRREAATKGAEKTLAAPTESGGVEATPLIPLAHEPKAETGIVGEAAAAATAPTASAGETAPPIGENETAADGGAVEAPSRDLGAPDSPLVDAEGFGGSWSIQLASFRTPEKADAEWKDLVRRHADVLASATRKIIRFDLGEELGVRYRLRAGPYATKAEAEAACAALLEAGGGCLVVAP